MAQPKRKFDMTRDMWEQLAVETKNIPSPSPIAAKKFATPKKTEVVSPLDSLSPNGSSACVVRDLVSAERTVVTEESKREFFVRRQEESLSDDDPLPPNGSSACVVRDLVSAERTLVTEESKREFFVRQQEESLSDDEPYFNKRTACEITCKTTETITETSVEINYPESTDDDSTGDEDQSGVGKEDDDISLRAREIKMSSRNNSFVSPRKSIGSDNGSHGAESDNQSPRQQQEDCFPIGNSPLKVVSSMSRRSGSSAGSSQSSPSIHDGESGVIQEHENLSSSLPAYENDRHSLASASTAVARSPSLRRRSTTFAVPGLTFSEVYGDSITEGNEAANDTAEELPATDIGREIADLQTEAEFQQSVVAQVRRTVLASSRSASQDMVQPLAEAQRALMFADRKRKGCLAEIARLKSKIAHHLADESVSLRDPNYNARMAVRGIELALTEAFIDNLRVEKGAEYFIVIVFMLNEQVIATENLCLAEFDRESGIISVPNMFQFHHVEPAFKIEIEAYVIRVPKTQEAADDQKKSHTPGFLKKIIASLPKSASKHDSTSQSASLEQSTTMSLGSTSVSLNNYLDRHFILSGGLVVMNQDVNLHMDLNLELDITCPASGFLTFHCFMDAGTDWIRRWCQLQGSVLYFWRYPDDMEKKVAPLGSFDLKHCLNSAFHKATSQQCARAFSFVLTADRAIFGRSKEPTPTDSTYEYFVAADGKDTLLEWLQKLNTVLKTLHAWNQVVKAVSSEV